MSFISTVIHHGRFGAALAQAWIPSNPQADVLCAETVFSRSNRRGVSATGDTTCLLAMATPDLLFLQRICESQCYQRVLAAFLFERYLVVTPVFTKGNSCAECFQRRFVSQPPFPYKVEATEALVMLAGVDSGHEHIGYTSMMVEAALALANSQLQTNSRRCVLIDMAGTAHQSARLVGLHGCQCRCIAGASLVGPARFTAFQHELSDRFGDDGFVSTQSYVAAADSVFQKEAASWSVLPA